MIETVGSMKLARAVDNASRKEGKIMQVLIEINSGEEPQKAGVMPGEAISLIREISELKNVRIMGLMTMGPFAGSPSMRGLIFRKQSRYLRRSRR